MKPLLLSTFDTHGGAARAAYRLHHGLRKAGVDSRLFVQEKRSDDWTVKGPETKWAYLQGKLRAHGDVLPLIPYKNRRKGFFSTAFLPDAVGNYVRCSDPDIIHLHWVSYGFLKIETLSRLEKPMVWTLHDMWPFTGGCHYSGGCRRYEDGCGNCPLLCSEKQWDLSRWNFRRKERSWKDLPLTIVSPSNWLAECARRSPLFKGLPIEVIPNGIDLERFTPRDKRICREILCLPDDVQLILAGAMDASSDERKGFHHLFNALRSLKSKAELVVIGSGEPPIPPDFGVPVHYLGMLDDEISLSLAYGATDIFVSPSQEENLSNMLVEALSCAVPCVSFRIGGMPDLIDDGVTGFLATPGDPGSLAEKIDLILKDDYLRQNMKHAARQKAECEFGLARVVGLYGKVYAEALRCYGTPR
ncbi:glycosyltransferase family 4 protein [Geomobilimonas luticola]|uniref:Glycosyltransferase family 4 protein n=1 Tax=Geomobilimonas luticola TaxID=1114878 RepID=A0ABS5SCE2_9BACT|nr:glycosyltransferase family 4 protein [Geomobilimonas luticola]